MGEPDVVQWRRIVTVDEGNTVLEVEDALDEAALGG